LEPDSDAVNPSEKATQLAGKSSASHPIRGQPHQPSSSSSDVHAALEYGRLIELERQLSETVVPKTERDRHIGQPIDELTLKNALLAQAAEEKERAGLELRNLQAKLDESLLSRDQAKATAAEETKHAGLEQRELRAKLDELTRSRDQAKANAAEEMERAGLEQRELRVKLDELMLSRDQAKANAAEEMEGAGLEQRELQAKLDELTLSRDELLQTLEQAQGALQKATSPSADANERSQPARAHETELAEVRAELEGKKSELAAVRLRLTDAEDGLAKSKAEADTLRAQTADVDRLVHRLMERMRAMENEMSSLRGNEKSMEDMECRNEE
jgi:DNA repair exonuclease SbcCD ATPase subunit